MTPKKMNQQPQNLGKIESVHPISPAHLQKAFILIILSFMFFMAMLIIFSLRQNIGYFLLATAFLIIQLLTLFGWMSQRKKILRLHENGFTLGKQTCLFSDIEKMSANRISKNFGGIKNEYRITKTTGERIFVPEMIHEVSLVFDKIEQKTLRK